VFLTENSHLYELHAETKHSNSFYC